MAVIFPPAVQGRTIIMWDPTTGWPARPTGVAEGQVWWDASDTGGHAAPVPADMADGDKLVRRPAP